MSLAYAYLSDVEETKVDPQIKHQVTEQNQKQGQINDFPQKPDEENVGPCSGHDADHQDFKLVLLHGYSDVQIDVCQFHKDVTVEETALAFLGGNRNELSSFRWCHFLDMLDLHLCQFLAI